MQEIANGGLKKVWGWSDLVPRFRYRSRPYAGIKGVNHCSSDMVGLIGAVQGCWHFRAMEENQTRSKEVLRIFL